MNPNHPTRPRLPALRLAASLAFGLLLSGCAMLTPAEPPATPAPDSSDVRTLSAWTLDGKLGLRFLGHNISAIYRWQRLGNDYDAEASGPLGQGRTTLSSREGHVVLENAWLGRHESDDATGLTQALTTMPIPLPRFNAWLMGWPANPDTPIRALSEPDGLREFDEDGWTTRVIGEQTVAGYRIPTRLVLTQDSNRLVLTLAGWQPVPAGTAASTGVVTP